MEYTRRIIKYANTAFEEIENALKDCKSYEQKYTGEYLTKHQRERQAAAVQIYKKNYAEVQQELGFVRDAVKRSREKWTAEAVDSTDIKALSLPISYTKSELLAMAERNAENPLVIRAVVDKAKAQGIDMLDFNTPAEINLDTMQTDIERIAGNLLPACESWESCHHALTKGSGLVRVFSEQAMEKFNDINLD